MIVVAAKGEYKRRAYALKDIYKRGWVLNRANAAFRNGLEMALNRRKSRAGLAHMKRSLCWSHAAAQAVRDVRGVELAARGPPAVDPSLFQALRRIRVLYDRG